MTLQTEYLARRSTLTRARRSFKRSRAAWLHDPDVILVGLLVLLVALLALGLSIEPFDLPPAVFAPFVVVAGLFLGPGRATVVFVAALVAIYLVWNDAEQQLVVLVSALLANLVVMSVMWWISASRSRLGLTGIRGEQILVDLREGLRRGGELPDLPLGWHCESSVHSAHGAGFAGDFILAARTGSTLQLALVDVSGKGEGAGSRSLLLSGAFGGLLGSVPPGEFLSAANAYLIRQEWPEGFATCIHVVVELADGSFSVGSAGHPPAAIHDGGTGRWEVLGGAAGPLLGVVDDVAFDLTSGRLDPGDSLLVYTDGVIETRGLDLESGIDRMLGLADREMLESASLTDLLCQAAPAGELDDRAAILVARR